MIALLLACGMSAFAGEGYKRGYKHDQSFAVPAEFFNEPDFHPVGYLKSFPVANENAKLKAERKSALRRLFLAAYCACKAKLGQDYPLSTSTPLYRLLKANYPEVKVVEGEGGKIVMLGRLATSLENASGLSRRRSRVRAPSAPPI